MIATEAAQGPGSDQAPTVCGCGQDLDCCEREHCPRCGCQVNRAA